jgi:hypothetical protein
VGLSTVWAGRIVGVEAGARGKATSCVLVSVPVFYVWNLSDPMHRIGSRRMRTRHMRLQLLRLTAFAYF